MSMGYQRMRELLVVDIDPIDFKIVRKLSNRIDMCCSNDRVGEHGCHLACVHPIE